MDCSGNTGCMLLVNDDAGDRLGNMLKEINKIMTQLLMNTDSEITLIEGCTGIDIITVLSVIALIVGIFAFVYIVKDYLGMLKTFNRE